MISFYMVSSLTVFFGTKERLGKIYIELYTRKAQLLYIRT